MHKVSNTMVTLVADYPHPLLDTLCFVCPRSSLATSEATALAIESTHLFHSWQLAEDCATLEDVPFGHLAHVSLLATSVAALLLMALDEYHN